MGAKRDLYKHLRIFVSEGGTVIFLSSELEEFIGLCHRVLVFRDGRIFETFEKEDIEANIILEGMFGHSKKTVGNNTISNPENNMSIKTDSSSNKVVKKIVAEAPRPENIKIVDFNNKIETKDKIKIKYF